MKSEAVVDAGVDSPMREAKGLLQLLCTGETVAGLRKLIGNAPERASTLRAFDLLVLHLPKHPERQKKLRLRRYSNPAALSPDLRAEIVGILKTGMSQIKVSKKVPVGLELVRKLARQYRKPKRITPEQIVLAEQMAVAGKKWNTIARSLGVTIGGLMKRTTYRKLKDPQAVFVLPREKRDAIVEALRSGKSRQEVKHLFGVKRHTVDRLYRRHLNRVTAMGD